MVVLPDEMPVTIPDASTVPTEEVTLLHAPPMAASVKAVFAPAQTTAIPVTVPALGDVLTVTTCVAAAVPQLLLTVYDIVVLPARIPLTTPVALTVPTEGVTLLQIPPAAASVKAVFAPAQTRAVPVIVPGLGNGFTVTTFDAASVPQLLVIV